MKLHIDEKFRRIIRDDSVASIETESMVGRSARPVENCPARNRLS